MVEERREGRTDLGRKEERRERRIDRRKDRRRNKRNG